MAVHVFNSIHISHVRHAVTPPPPPPPWQTTRENGRGSINNLHTIERLDEWIVLIPFQTWYHGYYLNPHDLIPCCEYLIVLQS